MGSEKDFQVVIAGAGPGGTVLARGLAAAGFSVAVFDIKPEGSLGGNWSDAIEKHALSAAGIQLPAVTDFRYTGPLVKTHETDDNLFEPHVIKTLQIWSPDLSSRVISDVPFDYILTDRRTLGQMLAEQATAAGAQIFYNHRVEKPTGRLKGSLIEIDVAGIHVVDLSKDAAFEVSAQIVVDASGHISRLRTAFPDETAINQVYGHHDMAFAARTVRKFDMSRARPEDLTDKARYGAYKGYFWTYRHSEESIEVGGGGRRDAERIDPKSIINEMIAANPAITDTELRRGSGMVLVGRSPFSLAASGFLAIGDAAGQVIPTNGCGTGGSITGALLAFETIEAALVNDKRGIEALWPYNRKWFNSRGSHFAALWTLKEIILELSHKEISFLIKKEILNARILNAAIHGRFEAPDFMTVNQMLLKGIFRPGLLMKLKDAVNLATKIYHHYQTYPENWSSGSFYNWVGQAEKLFKKIK